MIDPDRYFLAPTSTLEQAPLRENFILSDPAYSSTVLEGGCVLINFAKAAQQARHLASSTEL